MRERQKGFARIILVLIIFIVALSAVVFYFINKLNKKTVASGTVQNSSEPGVQDSQSYLTTLVKEAKLKVESETKILEDLASRAQLEKNTVDKLKTKYANAYNLIEKDTDVLFKNPKTTKPEIKIKTNDAALRASLNLSRKQLQGMLNEWKAQLDEYTQITKQGSKIESSDITISELVKTTEQNIDSIESYISQLQNLVNNLSANSSLSDAQIVYYQSVVSEAAKDLAQISSSAPVAIVTSPNIVSQPIVTPAQITAQQTVVSQAIAAQVQVETQVQAQIDSQTNPGAQVQQTQSTGFETTPPLVVLTSPGIGSTVSYTVSVSASASDTSGIAKVEFYNESALIGTDTTSPYSIGWDTSTVVDGTYGLSAKAYDTVGNTRISTLVSVITSNGININDGIKQSADPELIEGANLIGF